MRSGVQMDMMIRSGNSRREILPAQFTNRVRLVTEYGAFQEPAAGLDRSAEMSSSLKLPQNRSRFREKEWPRTRAAFSSQRVATQDSIGSWWSNDALPTILSREGGWSALQICGKGAARRRSLDWPS